jgi:hypothetical protein
MASGESSLITFGPPLFGDYPSPRKTSGEHSYGSIALPTRIPVAVLQVLLEAELEAEQVLRRRFPTSRTAELQQPDGRVRDNTEFVNPKTVGQMLSFPRDADLRPKSDS